MKLADVEVLKVPCEIHVGDRGTFRVYLRGHAEDDQARPLSTGNTFDGAIESAKPAVRQRKVKVDVPFFDLTGSYAGGLVWKHGSATGFHAGTGNVLATVNGSTEQIGAGSRAFGRTTMYRGDMPKDVREKLILLRQEANMLNEQIKEVNKEWEFNLAEAVQAAIDKVPMT